MSKAIQSLVFASALCAAPLVINAQTIDNPRASADSVAPITQDIVGAPVNSVEQALTPQDIDDNATDLVSTEDDSDCIAPFTDEEELEGYDLAGETALNVPSVPTQDVAAAAPSTEQPAQPVQDVAAVTPAPEQVVVPAQDVAISAPSTEQPVEPAQDVAVVAPSSDAQPVQDVVAATPAPEQPATPAQDVAAAALLAEPQAQPSQDLVTAAASTEQPAEPAQEIVAPVVEEPKTVVAAVEDASADATDDAFDMAPGTTDLASVNGLFAKLDEMAGKDVFDRNGGLIGRMTGCDEETGLVAVELSDGRMVSVMPEVMTDMGIGIIADVTAGDVMTAAEQIDSDPRLSAITY